MFGPPPAPVVKPGTARPKQSFAARRMGVGHTTNAYMLMYRLVDKNLVKLEIPEDDIDEEVREDVELSEIKAKTQTTVQETKAQIMQLKVVHIPLNDSNEPESA